MIRATTPVIYYKQGSQQSIIEHSIPTHKRPVLIGRTDFLFEYKMLKMQFNNL